VCLGNAETNVIVIPLPHVDFEANPLDGCVPLTFSFTNTGDQGISYLWNYGNGITSNEENPTYTYQIAGIYSISLTLTTSEGCENSNTKPNYITVYPLPISAFYVSSQVVNEDNPKILFTDYSLGGTSWFWDFGTGNDNDFSIEQNVYFSFPETGNYSVWQYVENEWGCRDSSSMRITVKPFTSFYIPNAFSPNGDGANDYFMPYGYNMDIEIYKLMIYDRWGRQVFYSEDINIPWDGSSSKKTDKNVPIGVYSYIITVSFDGVERQFEGTINVVY
jgi:gliding motility-associated-like protein